MLQRLPKHGGRLFLCLLMALAGAATASAGMFRAPLERTAFAVLHNGQKIFLECHPPANGVEASLGKYLEDPAKATVYKGLSSIALPFAQLNPATQRAALLVLFPQDFVDAQGWHHTAGAEPESLEALCGWLTGGSSAMSKVRTANRLKSNTLSPGQQVLFPASLLRRVMRTPTGQTQSSMILDPEDSLIDLDASFAALDSAANELTFSQDQDGKYAVYLLKPGEALYTAVVVRFTDFSENKDVLAACDVVQKRSSIADVHNMPSGQRILIPLDMLSARYQPRDSRERQEYEEVVQEARRLKGQVKSHDLEGVVIVLDPGHGGRDFGATSADESLLEDELNYDIAVRAKAILESTTHAKVYITMLDPNQGYRPTEKRSFDHDTDEEVLTTPRYGNGRDKETQAKVSANLRWCIANSIYRRETAKGVDPRKMVFTSFHCDALFNGKPRGTMVYIPGASLRKDYTCDGPTYAKYKEAKEGGIYKGTSAERRRDEALSRNFAEVLLDELGKKRIRRHLDGDPIRSQIRQSGGVVYVPAVLRNNLVPTKVLVESANLTNPKDCERLADPAWRQTFAEAYVDALVRYYQD